MVINLMQLKMRKTYEARSSSRLDSPGSMDGASLGVLQVYSDKPGSDSRRPSKESVSTAKRLMLSQDGVHWFDDDKTPEEEERESLMRDNGTNDGDQIPIRLSVPRRPQKFIEL